jgi:uncharacterized protein YqjF (DUF2071 family)
MTFGTSPADWSRCRCNTSPGAEIVDLEQSLLSAAGLSEPDRAPLVQYSPGVDVRLGVPHPA